VNIQNSSKTGVSGEPETTHVFIIKDGEMIQKAINSTVPSLKSKAIVSN